jgi:hypothetical protein
MRDKKIDLLTLPSTNAPTTRNTSDRTEQQRRRRQRSDQQQRSRTTVNGRLQETNLPGTITSSSRKNISSLTKSKKV